jgi:hypothetical protein
MVEGQDEGKKFDGNKVRLDLVPIDLLWGVGKILTFGANKYGDRNWEEGIKYSRVYGALLRHVTAWWGGENKDKESGQHHLWHAACCIAFLMQYTARKRYKAFDDRPVSYKEELKWTPQSTPSKRGTLTDKQKLNTPYI